MAQRRMFSPHVTSTDKFLEMPVSSRELYFQLGMNADDDGFITPKKIIRMIGASDDDLKVLITKGFVIPFQSGVIVITSWRVNNLVRKDWYQETRYKDEKNLLGIDNNGEYFLVNEMLTNSLTEVRLGKDRLGKEKIGDDEKASSSSPQIDSQKSEKEIRVPYDEIIALYEQHCGHVLPTVQFLNNERKRLLKQRWLNELPDLVRWDYFFKKVAQSAFLMGRTMGKDRGAFKCSFDWLIRPRNCVKVLEDNYSDLRDKI